MRLETEFLQIQLQSNTHRQVDRESSVGCRDPLEEAICPIHHLERALNRQPSIACFFDAFGTLLYPRIAVPKVYRQVAEQYGETRSSDEIGRALRRAMQDVASSQADHQSSAQQERKYWRQVVSQVFGHLQDWDRVFEDLWTAFADSDAWRLFDDVLPTLDQLARHGIPVGIASNFDGRLHEICRKLFPPKLLRWILISADVGWRKPDPRFFRHVESQCAIPVDHLWMVGDDWQNDVRPVLELNWNAALVDRGGRAAVRLPTSVHRIQNLAEVVPLLAD